MGTGHRQQTHRDDATSGFELMLRVRDAGSESDEKRIAPLIVLIGFLGCTARIMTSIARQYEDRLDYDTAWTIPPTTTTFALTECTQISFARSLLTALSDHGHGGIILAPFSNAGAFIVRHILRLYNSAALSDAQQLTALKRVAGIIYDSCPCIAQGPLTGARALAVGGAQQLGSLYPMKLALALVYSSAVTASNMLRTRGNADGNFLLDMSRHCIPDAGELYLYSKNDQLCDYDFLSLFIEKRQRKINVCISHMFEDSPHVSHMRTSAEVYFSYCRELHLRAVDAWRKHNGLPSWKLPRIPSSL